MKGTVSILGCGWIGLPLARLLLRSGYDVNGSTTTPSKLEIIHALGARPFLVSDLSDSFFNVDVMVITLPFMRSYKDPWDYQRLFTHFLQYVFPHTRLIFTSSTSIYSDDYLICYEDMVLDLLMERQAVLHAVEKLVLDRQGVVLRLGGLYGDDRKIHYREPLDKPVNLIHRMDGAGILFELIVQGVATAIFNGVSDDHRCKRELFADTDVVHPIDCTGKIVSNAKVKELLGYTFQYPQILKSDLNIVGF